MRKREGIEPRDERRIVGADMISNMEGSIRGANGQGPREPTGVEDRGTSAGQDRELGRSDALLQRGGRAAQPAHREDAQWHIGSRMPPYERGRGVMPAEQREAVVRENVVTPPSYQICIHGVTRPKLDGRPHVDALAAGAGVVAAAPAPV